MRLQDLLAYPREDLDKELKSWLNLSQNDDKANIAQAILALANHGGGYILIGFVKEEDNWVPAEPRPSNLTRFWSESVRSLTKQKSKKMLNNLEKSFQMRGTLAGQKRALLKDVPKGTRKIPILIKSK